MRRGSAWPALVVAALCLSLEVPALADQDDPRLSELFSRLKRASSPGEAAQVERAIWEIWSITTEASADQHLQRGIRAMSVGDWATSLLEFEAVIAAAPDFAEGWNKRATLYYLIGEYEASVSDIERTLALEPRHFGALSGLALIREAQDRPFEALEALERVLSLHPHLPHLRERVEILTRQLGEPI